MGDTGPCGPCSEIFYDQGRAIPEPARPETPDDGGRFVEIWNLVFMQFEQLPDGERLRLAAPLVDTGWGSNASPQSCKAGDNYDIDLFAP